LNMQSTGNIAQFPRQRREELNRRLQKIESDIEIAEWLNSLPETGSPSPSISEGQVREWRETGYREWLAQQQALDSLTEMVAEADEWKNRLGDSLTDKFAAWLVPQYMAAARAELASQKAEERWALLRIVSNDLVALRRGDQCAERLRLEHERMQLLRQSTRQSKEAEFEEWLKRPEVRDKVCPRTTRDRMVKRMWQVMDHVMLGSPLEDFVFSDDEEKPPAPEGDTSGSAEPDHASETKTDSEKTESPE